VFNMGHRMELYVPEAIADELIRISNDFGIEAQIIGRCEASEMKKLTLVTEEGTFEY
jgi:phosphoribosylformylglycinamidine cyclo-ligase